jgi:diacylglycerol O-acyltransferase / wax synthase
MLFSIVCFAFVGALTLLVCRMLVVLAVRKFYIAKKDVQLCSLVDQTMLLADPMARLNFVNAFLKFEEVVGSEREIQLKDTLRKRLVSTQWKFRVPVRRWPLFFGLFEFARFSRNEVADSAREHVFERQWIRRDEQIDENQLRKQLGSIVASPLRAGEALALFEVHFWPRVAVDDEHVRSAMLFRFHHGLGDGMGKLRLLMQVADWDRDHLPTTTTTTTTTTTNSSQRRARQAGSGFSMALKLFRSFMRIMMLSVEPLGKLKPSGGVRSDRLTLTWATSRHSVTQLKALGRRLERIEGTRVTINDILLSALSGALRDVSPDDVKSTVWVSLSPLAQMYKPIESPTYFDNESLAGVYLRLPVAPNHSLAARLHDIVRQSRALLSSPEAFVTNASLKFLALLPYAPMRFLMSVLGKKTSLSLSNVPGPAFPIELGGTRVAQLCFWVPPQFDVSTFFCIISYNDSISVGVCSDQRALTEQEAYRIVGAKFDVEVQALDTLSQSKCADLEDDES